MDSTKSRIPTRIEGLDLLRGIAVLLVILRHAWPDVFGSAGIVGVVIFFALSGYLITGVLTRDIAAHGRVRYGRFYRNRAFRLLPPLFFLVIGLVVVEGALDLIGSRDSLPTSILVALTYTANIPGFDHGSPAMTHLWTLANEEQFYLLWPALLLFGIRRGRTGWVVIASAAAVYVALVLTILVSYPDQVGRVYPLPTSWTIAMLIGATAQLYESSLSRVLNAKRRSVVAGVSGIALLAICFVPEGKDNPVMYLLGGPLIAALTVAVVWELRERQTLPRMLVAGVWLGTISYAAYLWNWPLIVWAGRTIDSPWSGLIASSLTIVLACVSWFAIERPTAQLKMRIDSPTTRARVQLDDRRRSSAGRLPLTGSPESRPPLTAPD